MSKKGERGRRRGGDGEKKTTWKVPMGVGRVWEGIAEEVYGGDMERLYGTEVYRVNGRNDEERRERGEAGGGGGERRRQ